MDKILFYGANSFYSNFSPHRVLWQGHYWATAEHAYQAWKFFGGTNIETYRIFIKIKNANSPEKAKQLAKENKHLRNPGWDKRKLQIMETIVRAKLEQHPDKHEELAETNTKEMVENSPTDSFWGRGPDSKGFNYMGKIWMKLRDELNAAVSQKALTGPRV